MPTVNEARSPAAHLESRLQFEMLISDLSSRFINLSAGEVDREIENALRCVCEPVVGKEVALCLFRVAQEALNNVSRHAGARLLDLTQNLGWAISGDLGNIAAASRSGSLEANESRSSA